MHVLCVLLGASMASGALAFAPPCAMPSFKMAGVGRYLPPQMRPLRRGCSARLPAGHALGQRLHMSATPVAGLGAFLDASPTPYQVSPMASLPWRLACKSADVSRPCRPVTDGGHCGCAAEG
jgi:hypothetical protein